MWFLTHVLTVNVTSFINLQGLNLLSLIFISLTQTESRLQFNLHIQYICRMAVTNLNVYFMQKSVAFCFASFIHKEVAWIDKFSQISSYFCLNAWISVWWWTTASSAGSVVNIFKHHFPLCAHSPEGYAIYIVVIRQSSLAQSKQFINDFDKKRVSKGFSSILLLSSSLLMKTRRMAAPTAPAKAR